MVKRKRENKDVSALLKDLQAGSVFMRKSAIIDLAHKGATEATPELVRMLKDREATLRGCAAWALGELADKRSIKPLVECLKDMDVEVRRAAAQALSRIADPATLAALKDMRVDSDKWVAEWAEKGIARIGQETPPRKVAMPRVRKRAKAEILRLES